MKKALLIIVIVLVVLFFNDFIVIRTINFGNKYGSTSKTVMYNGSNPYFYSGNLGIGTTEPAYKLDINGTLRVSGASLFSSTLVFSDNIGIGTSTVSYYNLMTDTQSEIWLGSTTVQNLSSSDGSSGVTKTCSTTAAITVKNGLVTSCTND